MTKADNDQGNDHCADNQPKGVINCEAIDVARANSRKEHKGKQAQEKPATIFLDICEEKRAKKKDCKPHRKAYHRKKGINFSVVNE